MPKRLVIALLGTLLFQSACSNTTNPQPHTHHSQLLALGTLINISLWDTNEGTAATVVQKIDNRLQELHSHWHAWQPGRLHEINTALASGQDIELDDAERQLIEQAIRLSELSQGLFNPAIGQLIGLWGFHSDSPAGVPPTATEIATLLSRHPEMTDLKLDGNRLSTNNRAVQLDMGGFAKGYATDQAIEIIKQYGIQNAIINAGGDLRAIGSHGDRPWHIGIRHPTSAGVIAAIDTHTDESIFTSGNYERFYNYNGKRNHHIIDPRTGHPSAGALSVTVIHTNAASADAIATALMIAGPDQWHEIAQQMGARMVMLIDEQLTVHMTPAMQNRVKFEQPQRIIVSKEIS